MQGYVTNYVNLIADNLRDRYDNGFPIIKELIQNADDAKARTFIFSRHTGFVSAIHPLLKGPGLWFFNDGKFEVTDARALRSFGINTKAGDLTAIGKFGLGMKSVFHLCEALFYVAWDGEKFHREGLTPWKQEHSNPHPEWEQIDESDWKGIQDIAETCAKDSAKPWFLLWVPLRRETHLRTSDDEETGAIINRFPGDHPGELAFLDEPNLSVQLAEILPLLPHLQAIEHRDEHNSFAIRLETDRRLLGVSGGGATCGKVLAGKELLLHFAGRRRVDENKDSWFYHLKGTKEWPRSRYRDEKGHEQIADDKTSPEAAVLFCRNKASTASSKLHWAVFLPLELGKETLPSEHALVLHGQFFVDAGRKKIYGLERLHEPPVEDAVPDEATLRLSWNQRLAQQVLLPEVIPSLEHYFESTKINAESRKSLIAGLQGSSWFRDFRPYVCAVEAWVYALSGQQPAWKRVSGVARERLRPLPSPPKTAPARPWQVFPLLDQFDYILFDGNEPHLTEAHHQWHEQEIDGVLQKIGGLFSDGACMDYFGAFLDYPWAAKPYLNVIQDRLISLLRAGLLDSDIEQRGRLAEKSRRLFGCIEPNKRLALVSNLPEPLLRTLWRIETPILLVPKGLDAENPGQAVPNKETLNDWLKVIDAALPSEGKGEDAQSMLEAMQGLLKTLAKDQRGVFLRI